jgi:hypothetical protein
VCDGSDGELLQACCPPQDHQVQARLGRVALLMESRDTSAGIDSTSVPDSDPPDPHVFGPPGSGSTSQSYGSGSFYLQAKINFDSYCFVTSFRLFIFEKLCRCTFKK